MYIVSRPLFPQPLFGRGKSGHGKVGTKKGDRIYFFVIISLMVLLLYKYILTIYFIILIHNFEL